MDIITIIAGLLGLVVLGLLILPFLPTKSDGKNSVDMES
jgi:hypothetical protein